MEGGFPETDAVPVGGKDFALPDMESPNGCDGDVRSGLLEGGGFFTPREGAIVRPSDVVSEPRNLPDPESPKPGTTCGMFKTLAALLLDGGPFIVFMPASAADDALDEAPPTDGADWSSVAPILPKKERSAPVEFPIVL